MGFILIKGKFFIKGYQPDGDSIRFKPNDATLFDRITTEDRKPANVKVNTIGAAQLRIEAIDALETHYLAGTYLHQPWDDAVAARTHLLDSLGFTGVTWGPAEKTVTGVNNDGIDGYILTKFVDNNRYGRPVSFVFAGSTPKADGSDVFLNSALLKQSTNYKMIQDGFAYPTYYQNLYTDLRETFTTAMKTAQQAHQGLWNKDVSTKGFDFVDIGSITDDNVILPKLFRRLAEHISKNGGTLVDFKAFLEDKNDGLFVLGQFHKKNLNNLVEVVGNKVKLLEAPENIIFIPTK